MEDDDLVRKAQGLGDLELAVLLSLISREHLLIGSKPSALDEIVVELADIAATTFALRSAVIQCSTETTWEDFAAALSIPPHHLGSTSHVSTPFSAYSPQATSPDTIHAAVSNSTASYFPPPPLHPSLYGTTPHPLLPLATGPSEHIANVVIVQALDRAPRAVQVQALELMRTRRILTRISMHTTPRQFLLIAVVGGRQRLVSHIVDAFQISHWVEPEGDEAEADDGASPAHVSDDGMTPPANGNHDESNLASGDGTPPSTHSSMDSVVVHRPPHPTPTDPGASSSITESTSNSHHSLKSHEPSIRRPPSRPQTSSIHRTSLDSSPSPSPIFSESDIAHLAHLSRAVLIAPEVLQYQLNIISHLRLHRAVAGGVSPTATRHLDRLVRCLAPLHGLGYVTPALVALAAPKIYAHRVRVVRPARERSMQWGSEIDAVRAMLEGVGVEDVVGEVLARVAAPV